MFYFDIQLYMKIAIGFFGITRSLKYTINSINSNIFHVLELNNIDYDVYIQFYAFNIIVF